MCNEPRRPAARLRLQGFSLLESLIALLALSVGTLGLLKMAATGLSVARDSDHYVVASARATELMDTIRVVQGLDDSYWTITRTQTSSALTGEKRAWLASVENTLPGGKAAVGCTSGLCSIVLYWTPLAQSEEMSASFSIGKP